MDVGFARAFLSVKHRPKFPRWRCRVLTTGTCDMSVRLCRNVSWLYNCVGKTYVSVRLQNVKHGMCCTNQFLWSSVIKLFSFQCYVNTNDSRVIPADANVAYTGSSFVLLILLSTERVTISMWIYRRQILTNGTFRGWWTFAQTLLAASSFWVASSTSTSDPCMAT